MHRAIEVVDLRKTFASGRRGLDGISLAVAPGEMVALIGASGSGKSTLLRHIAGLAVGDRPGKSAGGGSISVMGAPVQRDGRLARRIRRRRAGIGFVFQQFNLVDRLPVLTNVMTGGLGRMPIWRSLVRWFTRAEQDCGLRALARVGIPECAWQRASTLSGGQQQRAAIARTLVQGASVVLADEPIASLDPESSRRVMEILRTINREDGITVVVSLHQVDYATRFCARVVALKAGRVVYDGPSTALTASLLREIYGAELDWDGTVPPQGTAEPAGLQPALAGA
ncbi:MAG: phosphonate ABC transporter ATP-binding protein [Pseudomonadota bacterium]